MTGTRVSRRSVLGSVGAASLSPALLQASISESALHPLALPAFQARIEVGQPTGTDGNSHWAPVTGGVIRGQRLAGRVQGGRIDWRTGAGGGPVEVTACFQVLCEDGRLVEVQDRGLQAAEMDAPAGTVMTTTPELSGDVGEWCARPALLVGRMDTSQLGKGVLKLHAFEVSSTC